MRFEHIKYSLHVEKWYLYHNLYNKEGDKGRKVREEMKFWNVINEMVERDKHVKWCYINCYKNYCTCIISLIIVMRNQIVEERIT